MALATPTGMMNAAQTTISQTVPQIAGAIPELDGSIRDGVSVKNSGVRLEAP